MHLKLKYIYFNYFNKILKYRKSLRKAPLHGKFQGGATLSKLKFKKIN